MGDQLLVLVPRFIEGEPGCRTTALFSADPRDLEVSTTGTTQKVPAGYLEPVSRRWMGAPNAAASTTGASGWTMLTGQATEDVEPNNNKGVVVSEEGTEAEPWVAEQNAATERLVGFQIDFSPFEPESWEDDRALPIRIEWGDKWRLEVTGNEQSASLARLYEKTGPPDAEWQVKDMFPLFRGKFFNPPSIHRLWIQPLAGDEFLIRNLDHDDLGVVVVTKQPVSYDPDEGTDDDLADGVQYAPWGEAKVKVSGVPRGYFCYRDVEFPESWSVKTADVVDLGYICTQDVTIEAGYYLPDGLRVADSEYAVVAAVYQGRVDEATPWAAHADRSDYSYQVTVTGPSDGALSGYSKRACVLYDLRLSWPKTLVSDGAVETDLFASGDVQVTALEERRGPDDADSLLTVTFTGDWETAHAAIADYCAPNARWQWWLDTDGDTIADYIRFDGLRDAAELSRYTVMSADGSSREYRCEARVSIRSRWRQLEQVVYRDGIPLDGLARSEAYYQLADEIPVGPTEAEIGTLVDDEALPAARPGQEGEFQPRIGARLADVISDVQRLFGPDDRILFRDRSGVATFYVDQPAAASVATFYRTAAEATAAGFPAQVIFGDPDEPLFVDALDDAEYHNEILVVGQDKDDPRRLFACHYANPPSWQDVTSPFYVGVRRPMIVVRPELNTQEAVDSACWALQRVYAAFKRSGTFQSHLVATIYPGDRVTVDAGADPGDVDTTYTVRGMTTRLLSLGVAADRRYRTEYEVSA